MFLRESSDMRRIIINPLILCRLKKPCEGKATFIKLVDSVSIKTKKVLMSALNQIKEGDTTFLDKCCSELYGKEVMEEIKEIKEEIVDEIISYIE